jgi:hypothetical protein
VGEARDGRGSCDPRTSPERAADHPGVGEGQRYRWSRVTPDRAETKWPGLIPWISDLCGCATGQGRLRPPQGGPVRTLASGVFVKEGRTGDCASNAYMLAKANDGAPNVDGESFAGIESRGRVEWLNGLGKDLHDKTYKPQPVRRRFRAMSHSFCGAASPVRGRPPGRPLREDRNTGFPDQAGWGTGCRPGGPPHSGLRF